MKKIMLVITLILVTIVFSILLLLIGATIGGNFFTDFEMFGRRGYEATGNIGLFLGVLLGSFISVTIYKKIYK